MSGIFESALCARCGVAEARCGTPGSKGYCFPCFPIAQREEWEAERLAAQEASPGPPSGKKGRARKRRPAVPRLAQPGRHETKGTVTT